MASTALPPADLLPVRREATLTYRAVRLVAVPIMQLVFRFDVVGKENIPRSGNYVVIANHLNWLDEFTLLMLFPVEPRIHFLANPPLLVTRKVQWFIVRHTGGVLPAGSGRPGDQPPVHPLSPAPRRAGGGGGFPPAPHGPAAGAGPPLQ